ncbi:asparagine synthase (glutamine-hydrolyzing) [Vibrio splendidus]|uniref:asparagine synthase (glutamine-hydrolyzing) n=1 Tax=Vibrio splendidus TaxID=29497 RepID=UPI000D334A42|nr:asparagine synthase (glutamine-hydrolyzing) [Vibrio splendidus]PTP66503.1 asparagine synthase (glutamine-hydrolyzing) [Vibrio splendidus]
MCGIFGYTNFDNRELERARISLQKLRHRGPDQWNDYFDDKIYIGHQRLSILDLSEDGSQPMISDNQDVIIAINGEIYNFQKLKEELNSKYIFKSCSDSEVVLHGYIEWGIDGLLDKIDGMYAISIYDKRVGELYLVRDRTGIKPLYYSRINNQVSWGSELKALQSFYCNYDLEYDYTAFYDFLTYLYIPTPKTMYKNVYKLEPGHYLKVDLSSNEVVNINYWTLEINKCDDDLELAKEKIRNLVEESINEQMVADVPVGFFLSGGMDSSTVVAIASLHHTNLNTFSIGFTDKKHDETHFAELIANKYNTEHDSKILSQEETSNMFYKIKEWYDEPFGDTSCFPTFLVSDFAKAKSTVVLTGDGGDEIFGGYNWYREFERIKVNKFKVPMPKIFKSLVGSLKTKQGKIGSAARKFEVEFLLDDLEVYCKLMGGMLKDEKSMYKESWGIDDEYDDYWYFRKFYREDLDLYTRLQFLDFHTYLHDAILTKVDRVSMAVSLECRVPFLKRELIDYSFSLNDDIRIHNGELKGIMKEAFGDLLPREIIDRDKKGFNIPTKTWHDIFKGKRKQEKILEEFNIKN